MEIEQEKRLEYLLQHKHFSELTSEERAFVLSIISEEEFENYRTLVAEEEIALGLSIEELTLRPEVKDTVLAAFKNEHKKEKRAPLPIVGFFKQKPVLFRVPVAFGVLALIGILIVNLNQNEEPEILEGPIVSDVMDSKEDDSEKESKFSRPEDSITTQENNTYPNRTNYPERKEWVNHKETPKAPKVLHASVTSKDLENSKEDADTYIRDPQAGMNEKLIIPEPVEFVGAGSPMIPEMYQNLGL